MRVQYPKLRNMVHTTSLFNSSKGSNFYILLLCTRIVLHHLLQYSNSKNILTFIKFCIDDNVVTFLSKG